MTLYVENMNNCRCMICVLAKYKIDRQKKKKLVFFCFFVNIRVCVSMENVSSFFALWQWRGVWFFFFLLNAIDNVTNFNIKNSESEV